MKAKWIIVLVVGATLAAVGTIVVVLATSGEVLSINAPLERVGQALR